MRFVLFSDLHLETPFGWEGPAFVQQRRRALRTVLSNIPKVADEVGADAVLCGGDLYVHTLAGAHTGSSFVWPSSRSLRSPYTLNPETTIGWGL